jgi:hypothetical protein
MRPEDFINLPAITHVGQEKFESASASAAEQAVVKGE